MEKWDPRAVRADGKPAAPSAAQYQPFAALKGLDALYRQKVLATTWEPRHVLTDDEAEELSWVVPSLRVGDGVLASVYDATHGRYVDVNGTVSLIDLTGGSLWVDGRRIALNDLREVVRA